MNNIMKNRSKELEEKALNYFKTFIEDSRFISQYIPDNDKEPFFDGHLYLYSDGMRDNKKYYLGRVPIQIKGKEVDDFIIDKWKFKLDKEDLEAYLHDPVFFVVCQIKKNSLERKLFYAELLPSVIKNILNGMENKKSKNILFKPMTENLSEFENQIWTFKCNREKMISFAGKKHLTIEDVVKKRMKSLSFVKPLRVMNEYDLLRYISSHETYLYAKPKDFDIDIPVMNVPATLTFTKDLDKEVKIKGRVFYKNCKNQIKDGTERIVIGNVLEFYMSDEDSKYKLKFINKDKTLNDIIDNTEFLIALHEHKVLTIGEVDIYIDGFNIDNVDDVIFGLERWKNFKDVLDKLHVTKQFDITNLSKNDINSIDILTETIGDGKSIKIPGMQTSFLLFEVSNIKLLLWCNVDKNGYCRIGDFFDGTIKVSYKINDKNNVELSPYSYLCNDSLWEKIDNIDYDNIITSTSKFSKENKYTHTATNADILAMISASDVLSDIDRIKSDKLLEYAKQLNQWLMNNDLEEDFKILCFVNMMQIIKRQRTLNSDEIRELNDVLSMDGKNEIKAGVCLLLEKKDLFDEYYNKLTVDVQESMKGFPIWRFYKDL